MICLFGVCVPHCQTASQLVFLDQEELTYIPFAMKGQANAVNTIPDFSHAGYMGGGVALPSNISIEAIVTPEQGDDADRIQAAINQVEALEPDQNGFRGVILIKAGHYSLDNLLAIKKSGVVLRGEGQGLNGTVLHANPRVEHNVINILGDGGINKDSQSQQAIISDYVPVGSYSFKVEDATAYTVGDNIVVTRTPNQLWVNELGMDQETLCGGDVDCTGWSPSTYTVDHERVITAISGNDISINIPIVDVIQNLYGGGTIAKIESSRRISHCGVENIRIQSFYDGDTDESHAHTAIRLKNTENCWVKKVTGQYLTYSTVNIESGNFTTVEDCAFIDPKSKVTGGRRYSFAIQDGLGNLFQRCYAVKGRHDFVTGSRVTGPNVFFDGLAESAYSDIGPHHRWATGTLFDNISGGSTRVWNRGSSGTGHGWSGAQTMFWNISSYGGEFRVDSPLGSMNWGIGCIGTTQTGEGYWESWGTNVVPRSLYLKQLEDRLGSLAVDNIALSEQLDGDIYEMLSNWGGQGDFSNKGIIGERPLIRFIDPITEIDVSTWQGGDITVEALDNDGIIKGVKLLINGEPIATDTIMPYIFPNLSNIIRSLSHEIHYLQAIATDNDGNTISTRLPILGGNPPMEEEEETEEMPRIKIFPNPSIDKKITIEMVEEGSYNVHIFDLQGKLVDSIKFEGINYQYVANHISSGMYIFEIATNDVVLLQEKILLQ